MPIVVQHGVNLGPVAYAAGLGQYQTRARQQDFENAIQAQKLAQDAQAQQARIEQANRGQYMQWLEMQQRAADIQNRQQLAAQQQQIGALQNQQELQLRGQQINDARDWHNNQLKDNQAQRENAVNLVDQRNAFDWNEQGTKNLEAEIEARRKMFAGKKLKPEGQTLLAKAMGDLRGIQAERGTFANRPGDYNKLLTTWMQKFDDARIDEHVEEDPTPEELLKQKSVPAVDPITGKPINAVWTFDRNGAPKFNDLTPKAQGGKQQADPTAPIAHGQASPATKAPVLGVPHDPKAMPSFESWLANDKTFNEEYSNALKTLTKTTDGGDVIAPSEKQIMEFIRKKRELQVKLTGGTGTGAPVQGPSPATPAVTQEQLLSMNEGLNQQLELITALPDGPDKQRQLDAWNQRKEAVNKLSEKMITDGVDTIPPSYPRGQRFYPSQEQDKLIPGMPASLQPGAQQVSQEQARPKPIFSNQEQGWIDNGFVQVPDDQLPPNVMANVRFVGPDGRGVNYVDPKNMPQQATQPQAPPPPVAQSPFEPAPATADDGMPKMTLIPEHKPMLAEIQKIVGPSTMIDEDRLARDVQDQEIATGGSGQQGGGATFLSDVQAGLTELAAILSESKKRALTSEERQRATALGIKFGAYLKRKSK